MIKKSTDQQSNNGMASGLGVWGGLCALIIWKVGEETRVLEPQPLVTDHQDSSRTTRAEYVKSPQLIKWSECNYVPDLLRHGHTTSVDKKEW